MQAQAVASGRIDRRRRPRRPLRRARSSSAHLGGMRVRRSHSSCRHARRDGVRRGRARRSRSREWDGDRSRQLVARRRPRGPSRCVPACARFRDVPTSSSCTTPRARLRSPALFDAVIDAVRAGADGAVPGLPVTDTLKRVDGVRGRGDRRPRGPGRGADAAGVPRRRAPRRARSRRRRHRRRRARRSRRRDGRGGARRPAQPQDHRSRRPRSSRPRSSRTLDELSAWASATTCTRSPSGRAARARRRARSTAAGLAGHSDADAVAHAVADALLGPAGLPDLGTLFPASDDALPRRVVARTAPRRRASASPTAGWQVVNVDVVIAAEEPRLAPHLDAMTRNRASTALGRQRSCRSSPSGVRASARSGGRGHRGAGPSRSWNRG